MITLASKYYWVLDEPASRLLGLLEKFINGATVQIDRVERAKRQVIAGPRNRPGVRTGSHARLFLDAHFYFICIGQVNKSLGQLCRVLKNARLQELRRDFEAEFRQEIRNDLEHLDERAIGKIREKGGTVDAAPEVVRAWRQDWVNFCDDKLSFGGRSYPINRAAAQRLRQLYRQVIAVIREDYALKDARFVEEEVRDARIKQITRRVQKFMSRSTARSRQPKK